MNKLVEEDSLRELSSTEVKILSDLYKLHQERVPHIFSFIQTMSRWKQLKPNEIYANFYVPKSIGQEWKTSGIFVAIGHFQWKILLMFTLNNDETYLKLLEDTIASTNKFDYKKYKITYYAIYNNYINLVENATARLNLTKTKHEDTFAWHLRPEKFRKLKPKLKGTLNHQFICAPLNLKDAKFINTHWPHHEPGSIDYVRLLIEMNGGYGIYTKCETQLVAWILQTPLGKIGLLHVLEKYRRRGFAYLLLVTLSSALIDRGFHPSAIILKGNSASETLFSLVGFERLSYCTCMTYK